MCLRAVGGNGGDIQTWIFYVGGKSEVDDGSSMLEPNHGPQAFLASCSLQSSWERTRLQK